MKPGDKVWALYAPSEPNLGVLLDDDPAEMAHFLGEAGYLHVAGMFTEDEMAEVSADMDRALPAYTPDDEREVVEAFTEIATNIRRGYSIGYSPTNAAHDGRFRRVKVQVRAPGFKSLKVRARDGYLAPRHADDR